MPDWRRWPSAPYVIPFCVFMLLLAVQPYVPLPQTLEFGLRCIILTAVLWYFSRNVVSFKLRRPLAGLALGVGVFLIWIGPDALIPGYRQYWLFNNAITGQIKTSLEAGSQTDLAALMFRILRAVLLVPIIEELFWRAWALRWVARNDFESLPLGSYTRTSFLIVALLFAAEHGPYWDVGLVCGLIYNWWMGKTKSLGDLIFTHAVTNGCLCGYVLLARKWEYWM
jgi:CAAX prenyl protease-like protein